MAEDVRFHFILSGKNEPDEVHPRANPHVFTDMAARHVVAHVRQLNRKLGKPGALINRNTVLRFYHLDFQNDQIRFHDHFFPPKGIAPIELDARKQPVISWSPLQPSDFVKKSSPMSIVDLYHAIRHGADPATGQGLVLDVSMYSHGFVEGPVLRDSTDRFDGTPNAKFPTGEQRRDPSDGDGRARTDFEPNMGEDPATNANALAQFRAGFAAGATFRVFGCNVQDVVIVDNRRRFIRSLAFELLREAYTRQVKTAIGPALRRGVKPAGLVKLDLEQEFQNEFSIADEIHNDKFPVDQLRVLHYASDSDPPAFPAVPPSIFVGESATPPAGHTVDRSYDEIVKFAARQIVRTYIFKAAAALPNVKCFGALPGISGELDQRGTTGDDFRMSADRSPLRNFYDKYLGVGFEDPDAEVQRHYGIFDAATVAKINQHLTNG
jgi:hypothetical protein